MTRSYANIQALAAVAVTNVPLVGFQSNQKVKLLEIRTPADVIAQTIIYIFVDGMLQYQIVPSIYDNVLIINEDLPQGVEITLSYVKTDAVAQVMGTTMVFKVDDTY